MLKELFEQASETRGHDNSFDSEYVALLRKVGCQSPAKAIMAARMFPHVSQSDIVAFLSRAGEQHYGRYGSVVRAVFSYNDYVEVTIGYNPIRSCVGWLAFRHGAVVWQETQLCHYTSVIPKPALRSIDAAIGTGCFDEVRVASVRFARPVKDPIAVGRIYGLYDRFLIAQWDDDIHFDDLLGASEDSDVRQP